MAGREYKITDDKYPRDYNPQSNPDFKRAFRQAVDSGLKKFTWRGKSYNTEMAPETKSKGEKKTRVKKNIPFHMQNPYGVGGPKI